MSHVQVSRFVTRALEDEELRRQLEDDPANAFQGYDLSDEEKQAIANADETKLRHLGLDPMTARSWHAFHDVEEFAPDRPDAPGDLRPRGEAR
jgi:hypothetical protein